jgi:hypothetical protein
MFRPIWLPSSGVQFLEETAAIITKADNGKTIVIPTQEECEHKVNNFIQDNKFTVINNPTHTTLPKNHKTNTKTI